MLLMVFVLLFTAGCTTAKVDIGRDGSGQATLTIAKSADVTEASIRENLDEIFEGVGALSGDEYRLKLKSLEETDDTFLAVLSFKRIQYTEGLGDYNYMAADDFLQDGDLKPLIKNWSRGRFKSYQAYDQKVYNFSNYSTGDTALAFKPTYASTGKSMTADEFIDEAGILSQSKKGRVFTFFIADLQGLESVTFSFAGNIEVYGSKNAELVDESTITVYPVQAAANVLSTDENGAAVSENRDISCFVGYVYFELGMDGTLLGVLIGAGLLLAAFIVYGIFSGLFKRIIHGKKMKLVVKNYGLYLMLLPAIVLLVLFTYIPMGGVVMAFKNFRILDGIWGSEWTAMGGFKNFYDLFTSPAADFLKLAKNTLILAGLRFIFGFLFAVLLAILFSYLKTGAFKKTVQTISYFPYFISWVTISGIAYLFLAKDGGVLNSMIVAFGGKPIQWYAEPKYWRTILTFTYLWKTMGYSTIVYLAAITSINPALYEAATIDGAGRVQQLFHITLPGLFPILGLQIIFSLGNLVKDDFDQIYTMVGGSNAALSDTTEVIGTIVFKSIGSPNSYSSASAMSLLQGVVGLILVASSNAVVKKLGGDGAF